MMIENYYSALFENNEAVCFAWKTNDWAITSLSKYNEQRSPWISVNPIYADRDNDPESSLLPFAKSSLPRRADCNVSAYRTILIEADTGSMKDQWAAIRDCGLPFTTSTFSGGKSIHFVISLSDPCSSRTQYDELFYVIQKAIPMKIDPACKNPSRLTRNPGVLNPKHKREQKLIEVRERVSQSDLKLWAASRGILITPRRPIVQASYKQLPQWVEQKLRSGIPEGERNDTMFKLSCIMAKSGMQIEEAISRWQHVPGFAGITRTEIENTVKSAYRRSDK